LQTNQQLNFIFYKDTKFTLLGLTVHPHCPYISLTPKHETGAFST